MAELKVRASAALDGAGSFVACIGETSGGDAAAWLERQPRRLGIDDRVGVADELLLPCPPSDSDRLLALLLHWPGWRVTKWAGVEIGSGVLIVGSGRLASQVAQLCRCCGASWRAVLTEEEGPVDAEYQIAFRSGQQPAEVLRALPARADSAIVLEGGADGIRAALQACRDGGNVVVAASMGEKVDLSFYPDVHRRNLTLCFGKPFQYGPEDAEGWLRAAGRMNVLIALGRLRE